MVLSSSTIASRQPCPTLTLVGPCRGVGYSSPASSRPAVLDARARLRFGPARRAPKLVSNADDLVRSGYGRGAAQCRGSSDIGVMPQDRFHLARGRYNSRP